jgi:hypothetical protein
MDAEGRKVIVCDNGTGVSILLFLHQVHFFHTYCFSILNVVIVHQIFLIFIFHVWLVDH